MSMSTNPLSSILSGLTGGGSGSDLMSTLGQLLGLAGSGAAQTTGLLNTLGQQNFIDQGKINVLNYLNNLGKGATGAINPLQSSLYPYLSGTMTNAGQNYFNGAQGAQYYLDQGLSGTNAFTQMANPNNIPGLSQVLASLQGQQGTNASGEGSALNLGQGNAPGETPLLNAGTNLLGGNTANNAYQQLLQSVGSNSLANGGYTSQLNGVTNEGQNLLNPNPNVTQAGNLASNIFSNGNPLLPMNQVISMAMNQNATQNLNQEQDLREQEMNRTGTTGPAVASGSQDQFLNNMQDQALQNQSSAVSNAIMGQQGLGLQDLAAGTGLFNASTGANLGYTGQGLNAILQAASQAGGLQNILGNLGLGGGSLGLSTAATGGSLLNSANSAQTGGLGALASLLGQGTNTNQALASNLFGTQNLNQTQNQNVYQALASMLGLQGGANSTALQAMLGSGSNIQSTLADYISQLTSSGTGQTPLFSQNYQPQGNPFNINLNTKGLAGAPGASGGSPTAGVQNLPIPPLTFPPITLPPAPPVNPGNPGSPGAPGSGDPGNSGTPDVSSNISFDTGSYLDNILNGNYGDPTFGGGDNFGGTIP